MNTQFFHIYSPSGQAVYTAYTEQSARDVARGLSAIAGAWPMAGTNGASWPWYRVVKSASPSTPMLG